MELGAFSVSLSVADMAASRNFYESLGFAMTGRRWGELDDPRERLHGDRAVPRDVPRATSSRSIRDGRVQGQPLESFTDVRELRARVGALGIEATADTTGDSESGPASFVMTDPDGNAILIDQHV